MLPVIILGLREISSHDNTESRTLWRLVASAIVKICQRVNNLSRCTIKANMILNAKDKLVERSSFSKTGFHKVCARTIFKVKKLETSNSKGKT